MTWLWFAPPGLTILKIMITPEQQKWIDHLKDNESVVIVPYDPTSEAKFLRVKKQVQNLLGDEQEVLHRGASSLKISGQNEIDVYIPVAKEKFDEAVVKVSGLYGKPRSNYVLKRARFVTYIEKNILTFSSSTKTTTIGKTARHSIVTC